MKDEDKTKEQLISESECGRGREFTFTTPF
jgi:hypothetical protein